MPRVLLRVSLDRGFSSHSIKTIFLSSYLKQPVIASILAHSREKLIIQSGEMEKWKQLTVASGALPSPPFFHLPHTV